MIKSCRKRKVLSLVKCNFRSHNEVVRWMNGKITYVLGSVTRKILKWSSLVKDHCGPHNIFIHFFFFFPHFTCTPLPSNQPQSITHPSHQCISVGSCSLPSCWPQNHKDLCFVSDLFSSLYFQVYKNLILTVLFWTYSILCAFWLWLNFVFWFYYFWWWLEKMRWRWWMGHIWQYGS